MDDPENCSDSDHSRAAVKGEHQPRVAVSVDAHGFSRLAMLERGVKETATFYTVGTQRLPERGVLRHRRRLQGILDVGFSTMFPPVAFKGGLDFSHVRLVH